MVLLRLRLQLADGQRTQVVQSLVRILEPTRALPGCVSCRVCGDLEDHRTVIFIEEWEGWPALEGRLREKSTRVLLAAMDASDPPPQVTFEGIGEQKGMEFVAAIWNQKAGDGVRMQTAKHGEKS